MSKFLCHADETSECISDWHVIGACPRDCNLQGSEIGNCGLHDSTTRQIVVSDERVAQTAEIDQST